MADLNPAIENEQHRMKFDRMLATVADQHLLEGVENGERYFYIPALERHRGFPIFIWNGLHQVILKRIYCILSNLVWRWSRPMSAS